MVGLSTRPKTALVMTHFSSSLTLSRLSRVQIAFKMDRKFLSINILGIAFMLIFTAFQTMGNIQVSEFLPDRTTVASVYLLGTGQNRLNLAADHDE